GHSYYLDVEHVGADFITLGIIERPWDRAQRSKEGTIFGFFSAQDFEPQHWKGGYPNPAFARMTERDGAWAARIIARFPPEPTAAVVKAGDYTDPRHPAFLTQGLLLRQHAILQHYFGRLSPLADVKLTTGAELCASDLARRTQTFPADRFHYSAGLYAG